MNEILGSIFGDLDPHNVATEAKPLSAILGERLDRATAEIEGEATGDPLAVARMQLAPGTSQRTLGYPEKAIRILAKARATFAARLGPDHPETLEGMNQLGNSYFDARQWDRALALREETLALRRAKPGPDHPDTRGRMHEPAESYQAAGLWDRALPLHGELPPLWKKADGAGSWRHVLALNALGWCLLQGETWAEAESVLREALTLRDGLGPLGWIAGDAEALLGWALLGQGRFAEAEPPLRSGYEAMKERRAELSPRWRARMPEDLDRLIELAEAIGNPGDAEAWRDEKARLQGASTPGPAAVKP